MVDLLVYVHVLVDLLVYVHVLVDVLIDVHVLFDLLLDLLVHMLAIDESDSSLMLAKMVKEHFLLKPYLENDVIDTYLNKR